MKRPIPIFLLLLLLLVPLRAHDAAAAAVHSGTVLRLHILADSDGAFDQRVKLLVRDAIRPLFEARESYADARAFVLEHGKELQAAADRALAEAGAPYRAELLLGPDAFPDRVYEGNLFPAGEYDALTVRLGRGAGHNWWCVLFPPLCIVTETGEPIDPAQAELTSAVWTWTKELTGAVRSRIREVLERWY